MFKKKSHKSSKKHHKKDENLLQQIGQEIEDGIKSGVKSIEETLEEIGNEINREVQVVTKKIKKKIGLFYKASFFILLTFSVVLAYFVILVSTTPKSFPFVTQKIREYLRQDYGDAVSLENTYISFTSYGTLKVSVKNLRIYHAKSSLQTQLKQERQEFLIPRVEAEFSLLNLLHSSFSPRKVKIVDPEIILDDFLDSSQSSQESSNHLGEAIASISYMRKEKLLTKSFEIENAKIIIKTPTGPKKIVIKKSQILTFAKREVLYISSTNQLNISGAKNDVNLNSSCQLARYDILKCDLFLVNFITKSIADLHPDLKVLSQVDSMINTGVSFVIDSGKFHNITFKADAKVGNFSFPTFFGEKMFFSDLVVKGEYDNGLGILNFSEIKADFKMHNDADIANPHSLTLKTHLDMSMLISDLQNWPNHRADLYIKVHNAPTNELEKLWPVYLRDYGIREWVITHINNGLVHDAYAKFSLVKNGNETELEKIYAELMFSGLDLKYSEDFPEVTKVNGSAKFTQKGMNVAITAGEVLGSKIYNSHISIDDFRAPITMLKIAGNSKGHASDSLKHADASPKFSSQVEKYLNGDSQNSFDIRIPLEGKLDLKHSYIAVNSAITGMKNEYVKGAVKASVKKDFGSEDFITEVNFTDAELGIKAFNIEKKLGAPGGLNLAIAFPEDKKIELRNVSLWKKESVVLSKKTQNIDAKISGNFKAEMSPFAVTELNIKNENFGRNSYVIAYGVDKKTSSQKLLVRGQVLDLAPTIQSKFSGFSGGGKTYGSSTVQIALDNLLLANSKAIKNFALGLKCANQFCYAGAAKGSYNKREQSLNLHLTKKPEDKFATLEGQITDVGYLAEALGISKIVAGGNANLKLQNKIVDKKPLLEGQVTFDDSITIYENPAVKRLATNDLFSKVRDKIFSNDKTIFDSVKLDFALSDGILDIKSLIANNYKIGITAKGTCDLKNDAYNIKGMIVPGFIVNNLFGIGNIPILGNVVGLLTGGEGGGLFGIRYEYTKKKTDKEAKFETNKVSSFVPTTIKNLFDLI